MTSPLTTRTISSPVGDLRLYAQHDELVGLYLPAQAGPSATAVASHSAILDRTIVQLREYFEGARTTFDLPLGARGTGFQERVWRALATIPYGETRSYGSLATTIGRPAASRAVGTANAKNPISIIVPCHRVIAASGNLTGYAGGMAAKRWLLEHERRLTRGAASQIHRLGTAPAKGNTAQLASWASA